MYYILWPLAPLEYKLLFLTAQNPTPPFAVASPEEGTVMAKPLGRRWEVSLVDLRLQICFLRARLEEGGAGKKIPRL
jgi:hypothetical protein